MQGHWYLQTELNWSWDGEEIFCNRTGKISAKTAEQKTKEEYKKYKSLHIGDNSQADKDYIKALEDMELNLLGEEKENRTC